MRSTPRAAVPSEVEKMMASEPSAITAGSETAPGHGPAPRKDHIKGGAAHRCRSAITCRRWRILRVSPDAADDDRPSISPQAKLTSTSSPTSGT